MQFLFSGLDRKLVDVWLGCKESNATLQSTSNSLEKIYISILFDYIVALILHDVR